MTEDFSSVQEFDTLIESSDNAEIRPVSIEGKRVDSHVAIWNTSKNILEDIVLKSKSNLIQHKDAFRIFSQYVKNNKTEISGFWKNNGGLITAEIMFGDLKIEDSSGSLVKMGIRLKNDYTSTRFQGEAFGYRDFCSNGMLLGGNTAVSFVAKHSKLSDLDKLLGRFVRDVYNSSANLKEMIVVADKDLFTDRTDMIKILERNQLGKKARKSIIDRLEERQLSRYTLYNGITSYATAESKSEKHNERLQKIASKILVTPRKQLLEV